MGDSNARPLVPETNALSTELIARTLNIIKPKPAVKEDWATGLARGWIMTEG